jgi:hypothetical protein
MFRQEYKHHIISREEVLTEREDEIAGNDRTTKNDADESREGGSEE